MSDIELAELEDALLETDSNLEEEPPRASTSFIPVRWQAKTSGTIILLMAFLRFCVISSSMMWFVPVFRLVEDAICHVYYEDESLELIKEMKCKIDKVQSRLAYMVGWFGFLNAVIGALSTPDSSSWFLC
jgi:MFS transporter, PCFT/HCP family, solute carrier family 46 (folate transporter), member 1